MKSITVKLLLLLFFAITPYMAYADIQKCGHCGGRGHIIGAYTSVVCSYCNGTGKIYVQNSNTNGRTVNGYILNGNQFCYFGNVTYYSNGVAYVANYNQPLKVYQSPINGTDYYVILTLPNYSTVTIYFNR